MFDRCMRDPFDQCFHNCEGCSQYIPYDDSEEDEEEDEDETSTH